MIEVKNKSGKVFIQIEYDEKHDWIYARWMGQLTVEDVQNGALKVLEEIKRTGCSNLLNDNKELVGHWTDANDWIANTWVPMAIAANLKRFAHVLSDYSFGQTAAEAMKVNVGDSFKMYLFKDIVEAKDWLTKD